MAKNAARRLSLFFPALLLAACTGLSDYHTACMDGFARLADQVACVRANVERNASLRDDTLVREYLLTGDLLAKQVADGTMSEDAARLEFIRELNKIEQIELERQAHAAMIERANRPHIPPFAACRRAGGAVECVRY